MFPSLADFLIGGECWPHAGPQAVQWMWVLLQELVQGEEGGAGPAARLPGCPCPCPVRGGLLQCRGCQPGHPQSEGVCGFVGASCCLLGRLRRVPILDFHVDGLGGLWRA